MTMENQRRKERERLWGEMLQRSGDDPRQMLAVALEALTEFPGDGQFLYRAAVCGMRIADDLEDTAAREEALRRAQVHAQQAVEADPRDPSARWIRSEIRKRLAGEQE